MMTRRLGSPIRSEKGQALVEFALILPVILLLVIGMLEFSRAWNLHQVMTDAAREGARRAVLANKTTNFPSEDLDSVKAPMWRYLAQGGYEPQYATMVVTPMADFKESGKRITIELSLPYKFFILPARSILMKTTFTMRNE